MCVDNQGYLASLQLGKIYQVVKPVAGDLPGDMRVIDEDGEDYIYPAYRFVPVQLPARAKRAVVESVSA